MCSPDGTAVLRCHSDLQAIVTCIFMVSYSADILHPDSNEHAYLSWLKWLKWTQWLASIRDGSRAAPCANGPLTYRMSHSFMMIWVHVRIINLLTKELNLVRLQKWTFFGNSWQTFGFVFEVFWHLTPGYSTDGAADVLERCGSIGVAVFDLSISMLKLTLASVIIVFTSVNMPPKKRLKLPSDGKYATIRSIFGKVCTVYI